MKRCTLILLIGVSLVGSVVVWTVGGPYYHASVCRRRLEAICKASLLYAGDFDEVYPDSLKRLVDYGISPLILTCPTAKAERGDPADIDRWSGYVLMAGVGHHSPPSSIFVYCPPENHDGRWGHVGFVDAHVETLNKSDFNALLASQGIVHPPKGP